MPSDTNHYRPTSVLTAPRSPFNLCFGEHRSASVQIHRAVGYVFVTPSPINYDLINNPDRVVSSLLPPRGM